MTHLWLIYIAATSGVCVGDETDEMEHISHKRLQSFIENEWIWDFGWVWVWVWVWVGSVGLGLWVGLGWECGLGVLVGVWVLEYVGSGVGSGVGWECGFGTLGGSNFVVAENSCTIQKR
ncbi:hypothetical protein RhiirA4_419083 [Rhizophagus irregularis]|uniref:Uncharacterized protein n=1 Tax=Rhizophagus irregularis TaxID=588596 RepID=A0A2I1GD00_9GLOM|nr:hypothetical protein RhiirA4_419083 [Rhizophagus irregularis]